MTRKVERSVPLTLEQFDDLNLAFHEVECIGKTLADTIVEVAERRAAKEKETWETVRLLAGATDKRWLRIDWIMREIQVLAQREEE